LNGFTVWADTYNGFGAFTSAIVDILKDECPKKAIILNSILNPNSH
jgi:hypothetical protein